MSLKPAFEEIPLDERVARKYISLKETAAQRGVEFDMSLTALKNIYRAKKCYYTGVSLIPEAGKPNSVTLDRKDASKGYVTGNVVACCSDFNNRKANLTVEDIELLHKKLCKGASK